MSQQTIFRVSNREKPYSQIGNAMIRDHRLSWEARGVMTFILSLPTDWQFNLEWLTRQGNIGRDRARRIIRELTEYGYCVRSRNRNDNGTLKSIEYVFTDDPQPPTEKPSVDENTTDWKPVTGEPALAKPTPTKKDQTNENQKGSSRREFDGSVRKRNTPAPVHRFVSEDALNKVRWVAPGWDRQMLLRKFMDWPGSASARNMDAAFLAWAKSFTKGKSA